MAKKRRNEKRRRKTRRTITKGLRKSARTKKVLSKTRSKVAGKNGNRRTSPRGKVKPLGKNTRKRKSIRKRARGGVVKRKVKVVRRVKRKRARKPRRLVPIIDVSRPVPFPPYVVEDFANGYLVIKLPNGPFAAKLKAVSAIPYRAFDKYFYYTTSPTRQYARSIWLTLVSRIGVYEFYRNKKTPFELTPTPNVTKPFIIEQMKDFKKRYVENIKHLDEITEETKSGQAANPSKLVEIRLKYIYEKPFDETPPNTGTRAIGAPPEI